MFSTWTTTKFYFPALARANGWSLDEPRWGVWNKLGQVTFSSTEVPTEAEIIKQLTSADFQPREAVYNKFLRENPNREDAMLSLLYYQYELALKKLRNHLVDNGHDKAPFPRPELHRPLTNKEDEEIWAGYAATLKLVVESEAWGAITGRDQRIIMPGYPQAGHYMSLSPIMRDVSQRLLPKVQEVVKEFPLDLQTWTLWLILHDASGMGSLLDLVASVEPWPGASTFFPNERVTVRLLEESSFNEIEKYYKMRFELAIQSPIDIWGEYWSFHHRSNAWRPAQILIDNYLLRSADTNADGILLQFAQWIEGDCERELKAAIALAEKYNRVNLAKSWSNIDLEYFKNNPSKRNESSRSTPNLSWIVLDNADDSQVYDAFSSVLESYITDNFRLRVINEKIKNDSRFAHLKPGWGLYDNKNNSIIDYSEQKPVDVVIWEMAKSNGIESMITQLEKHRRLNAKNVYVEWRLLTEYLNLADKRMEKLNRGNALKNSLSEELDNLIWHPVAQLLEGLLNNGRYRLILFNNITIPPTAIQSPIMRQMAKKLIPTLEDYIKRDPGYKLNYTLWYSMSTLTENKHRLLLDIFSALPPRPNTSVLTFSLKPLEILNKVALEQQNWDFIIYNSTIVWDTWLSWWDIKAHEPSDEEVWGILGPLIEALLVKSNFADADRVFNDFINYTPFRNLQDKFVQIAHKRNNPNLARKWTEAKPADEYR